MDGGDESSVASWQKELASWTPSTELERRQRSIVEHLVTKLQLESEIESKEEEWMRLISVVGDLGMAREVQEEKQELEAKRAVLERREQDMADALKRLELVRDEVRDAQERAELRAQEASAAEEELAQLELRRNDLSRQCALAEIRCQRGRASADEVGAELLRLPALLQASLREGEAAEAQLAQGQQQLEPLRTQLAASLEQQTRSQASLAESASETQRLRERCASAAVEAEAARAAAAEAEREKGALASELRALLAEAAGVLELRELLRSDVLSLPERLAATRAEIAALFEAVSRLQREAAPLDAELARLTAELDELRLTLAPLRSRSAQLAVRQGQLQTAVAGAQRDADELRRSIAQSTARVQQARDARREAEAAVPALEATREALAAQRRAAIADAAATATVLLQRMEAMRAQLAAEKGERSEGQDTSGQLQQATRDLDLLLRAMGKEQQKSQAAFGSLAEKRVALRAQLDRLLLTNSEGMQALAQAVSASCRTTEQLRDEVAQAFATVGRLEELTESRYVRTMGAKQSLSREINELQAACDEQVRKVAEAERGTRKLESELESTRRKLAALSNQRDDDSGDKPVGRGKGESKPGDELAALFGSLFSR